MSSFSALIAASMLVSGPAAAWPLPSSAEPVVTPGSWFDACADDFAASVMWGVRRR